MHELLNKFKWVLVKALMAMMALVLFLSIIELGWIIMKDIFSAPIFLLDINELLEVFGLFMLVIIGIELLETIMKTYLVEKANHSLVVISVAIIAMARKIIILDIKEVSGITLIGMGVIIVALSIGYYLIKLRSGEK